MTKLGKSDVKNTTKPSAARRSRNIHKTHVKKAVAVGWKFDSQYEITEKRRAIRTVGVSKLASVQSIACGQEHRTEIWYADQKIGDDELCCSVQPIVVFFDILLPVLEESRDISDRHEGHEGRAVELRHTISAPLHAPMS